MKTQTIEENPKGFHSRYIVSKANGEPVDPDAIYFVLRVDNGGDDPMHLCACRSALRAYAEIAMRTGHLKQLGEELWSMLNELDTEGEVMSSDPIHSYYWHAGYQAGFHQVPSNVRCDTFKAREEYAIGFAAGQQAYIAKSKETAE